MYEPLHICCRNARALWVRELLIFWGISDKNYSREPNVATDSLTPYLLFEAAEDKGICPDFLIEAVSRFEEDDTVKSMLTKAVSGLSYQLSNMTMNDNYKPYINVRLLQTSLSQSTD